MSRINFHYVFNKFFSEYLFMYDFANMCYVFKSTLPLLNTSCKSLIKITFYSAIIYVFKPQH